jgi:ornithine cyclodeaminase/alanine dehydrogenase-like protein (mu-crystallin family)
MEEKILFLGKSDIKSLDISVARIIKAIEKGLCDMACGNAQMPHKPTIFPRSDCFLRALPGYLKGMDIAGIKWVSAYPTNGQIELPLVKGLVLLNDPQTGFPLAIMEGNWITAWRTAAMSAVVAKKLAVTHANTLGICGAGVQGRAHLAALSMVLPNLCQVKIFDPNPKALKVFIRQMTGIYPDLDLQGVASAQGAFEQAQVVVTAAPMMTKPLAIIQERDLAPGMLLLPVDLDSYFHGSAFKACEKIFTDDWDQLLWLKDQGRFAHVENLGGDYGQLLTGRVNGRENDDECIMAISVGVALGDLVAADLIYREALARNVGVWLEL